MNKQISYQETVSWAFFNNSIILSVCRQYLEGFCAVNRTLNTIFFHIATTTSANIYNIRISWVYFNKLESLTVISCYNSICKICCNTVFVLGKIFTATVYT